MIHISFVYTNFTRINTFTKRSYRSILLKIIFKFTCFIFSIFSFSFILSFYDFIYFIFNFISSHIFWTVFPLILVLLLLILKLLKLQLGFIPWSSIVFVCFTKAFLNEEYVNLACSITLLWSGGSISSPVRYSYLSIFPDDNADIFAASLLISYCSFSSLILSSVMMISFYILSKKFFPKREGLSDARVA